MKKYMTRPAGEDASGKVAKVYVVNLFTPYIGKELERSADPSEIEGMMERCGFNTTGTEFGYVAPQFEGIDILKTPGRKKVLLVSPRFEFGRFRPRTQGADREEEYLALSSDMSIAGSTRLGGEDFAGRMKDTGVVIARYSMFYRGASGYTGRTPEEGGYSFDIPKEIDTVLVFMKDDNMLEAVRERDESRIRKAVDGLNSRLETPILVTPFLSEALKVNK